ncbi:MAG: dTMP kinase [Lachnospiraceae bacterium]|nr:dTMP kinase [Lachnospiraceae bacterium]
MDIKPGAFIALEGIDGCGKSTQASLLLSRLKEAGIACHGTMEPSGGPIGSLIRQVLTGRMHMDMRTVAGLFTADRLDHLLNEKDGILSMVQNGITVVTDRYYFSSYAYQSMDVPMEWIIESNSQSSAILRPSVTIFLDIDPDEALTRIEKNRFQKELFEKRSSLIRVRDNYMKAFDLLKDREKVLIIKASGDPEAVGEAVWQGLQDYL